MATHQVARYLKPPKCTETSPHPITPGKLAKWNGSSWDEEDPPPATFIVKTGVTTRLSRYTFPDEAKVEFSNVVISVETEGVEIESSDAKNIKFNNVEDTSANNTTLDNLISSHDFGAGNISRIRSQRNGKLAMGDSWFKKYRDQTDRVAAGKKSAAWNYPDFSSKQFEDWLAYYDNLRDFVDTCSPTDPVWPVEPMHWQDATVANATDTITDAAHGLADDEQVEVRAETLPGGLAKDTNYYVVSSATDTFKLSASQGGAAIDITSDGTNVQYRKLYDP